MRVAFDVPDGFLGCGVTMIYENENGVNMYSTSVTPDEVGGDVILVLPRQEKEEQ